MSDDEKRKMIVETLQNSYAVGCGCCAEYPDEYNYEEDSDFGLTEIGKRAEELGVSVRYLVIADELIEAGL